MGIDEHEVFGFSIVALGTGMLLVQALEPARNKSPALPVRLMCYMGTPGGPSTGGGVVSVVYCHDWSDL
jgi:hypothetical protein